MIFGVIYDYSFFYVPSTSEIVKDESFDETWEPFSFLPRRTWY